MYAYFLDLATNIKSTDMKELFELLKYTVPAIVVFVTTFVIIYLFLKDKKEQKKTEITLKYQQKILPLKLQAYERLVIFLERIYPESLVVRENTTGLTNQQLQQKLIVAIRSEFEHNISQQLYVSDELWSAVKTAKDSTIQLINAAALQTVPNQSSIKLGKAIIESYMQLSPQPIATAIALAKEEIKELG